VGGAIPRLVVLGSIRKQAEPGMVAHAFNPSTWEAEAGGFLSSRPDWSTE
jgi:major histocompatibility complex class I